MSNSQLIFGDINVDRLIVKINVLLESFKHHNLKISRKLSIDFMFLYEYLRPGNPYISILSDYVYTYL